MRKPILILLFGLTACDAPGPEGPVLIPAFADRATALSCRPVSLPVELAPVELRLASDSTWTVLDEAQRRVVLLDDAYRVLWDLALPATGPGAAPNPVSVALMGDTAIAVAARGGLRVVVVSRTGRELTSYPLEFIPHSLEATRTGLFLTPVPLGDRPPTLLVRLGGPRPVHLPLPGRRYTDMTVNALGNSALVEALPDESLLVVHQFLHPRAFRVSPAGEVAMRVPPTPDDAEEQVAFVPRSPITPDQMPRTLIPAMAMTVDATRSEVYLLTRSGRRLDGRPERALLRLTDDLEFIEGYTLPLPAASMVYLPRRRAVLILDDEDGFHECELPTAAVARHPTD